MRFAMQTGAAPLPPGAPVYASPESFPLLCASAALVVPVILTNLCVAKRREGVSVFSTGFLLASLAFSCAVAWTSPALPDSLSPAANGTGAPRMLLAESGMRTVCYVQGALIQFTCVAMVSYWLLVGLVLKKVVVDHHTMTDVKRRRHMYALAALLPAVLLTAIPLAIHAPVPQRSMPACWLREVPAMRLPGFDGWMLLALLVGGYHVVRVVRTLASLGLMGKLCADSWPAPPVVCSMDCDNQTAQQHHQQQQQPPQRPAPWAEHAQQTPEERLRAQTVRDYVVRHTLFLIAFLVVSIGVGQQLVVQLIMQYHHNRLSSRVFQDAYSSVGILGFLVFGTALDVRTLWWRWFRRVCCCGYCCDNAEEGEGEEEEGWSRRGSSSVYPSGGRGGGGRHESQSALSSQLNHALLEEGSFSVRGSWINDTFKPWLSIGSNNNPMAVPPGSAPETGAPKTLAPITGTSPRDLLGQTP